MLNLVENVSLKSFNTLGLDVRARYLLVIEDIATLKEALVWANNQQITVKVIGGGSNLILSQDIDALVLLIRMQGIHIISQQGSQYLVEVAAGVVWQELVEWAVNQGMGGIENLSLIYGTVGAAPVQNIGAYGVEFKDVCYEVEAINRQTACLRRFTATECQFSYRDSLFKQHAGEWIIINVCIKLDSQAPIHIAYSALQQNLPTQSDHLSYAEMSQLVIKTRQQRLPDPKSLANVGSFFKNPIVPLTEVKKLKLQYPDLVIYPFNEKYVKLAAGWLIEKAGWKGCREGAVGIYEKQALVLVNYGNATGQAILAFAKKIQIDIKKKFNVELELEPVLL